MTKIKVDKLTKVFGKRTRLALQMLNDGKSKGTILSETGATIGVNQASFEVKQGEIFVIMGLSGSGKSTLVRLLNRLIEPTSGNVWIDGENLANMSSKQLKEVRRKKMSMVFQKFGLFPFRTVLQNVEYGLEIQGIPKDKRKEKALKSLELVGLKGYEDQYPDQLSGGMQQRVGLARALANDPEILLMDEAFSALDPLIRKDMQDELIDLQTKMKKTIIFITHDLDEALRLGDRIALMRDGSIVQIGTPEEILVHPANDYVERFVEDVNISKILTAQHIMKRPEMINIEKHGPRVALDRMERVGISGIFVVDNERQLIGYLTADAALEARKNNLTNLKELVINNIPKVEKDTPMQEIFNIIHDSPVPVAVVENNKLQGVIVRGSVIAALSGDSEVNLNVE